MSFDSHLDQRLEQKLSAAGYSLVKLNLIYGKRKNKVEVMIYSKEGITHKDCSRVTRLIQDDPDLESQFGEQYFLEVSSPGIYRKLTTLREFRVFYEKTVEFALRGESLPRFGVIQGVGEDEQIFLKDTKTKETVAVRLEDIEYAKLADDKGE